MNDQERERAKFEEFMSSEVGQLDDHCLISAAHKHGWQARAEAERENKLTEYKEAAYRLENTIRLLRTEMAEREAQWQAERQKIVNICKNSNPTYQRRIKQIEDLLATGPQPPAPVQQMPTGLGTCRPICGQPGHTDNDKPHVRNDACWNWRPV